MATPMPIPGETAPVAAISVRGLAKTYGPRTAVQDVSFDIPAGEVFGLLGPNGAGKTTTMKVLVGLTRATRGAALLAGMPCGSREANRLVGYLPESFAFHRWMTGHEVLVFHARLAGLAGDEGTARAESVLERVGLGGRGRDKVGTYSKGMAQRLGIAQALVASPRVVLLDEPTSALDPVGRTEVRDLVRELRHEGVAVLLNSHLLSEIERVCDRVAIMDRGRIVSQGRLDELLGGVCELSATVDWVDDHLWQAVMPYGRPLSVENTTIRLEIADPAVAADVAAAIIGCGRRLFRLETGSRSLEDLFVQLVQGGDR
ncbi:MAG: ABC transporter ATP-binding protein [Acidimicrobiia bacterium]|nr:ABC transporter ATP-binding protein [Acidimicrobiia bacterium]